MELKRLLSLVRKAIDDYNMIDEGDKIAVGISGGKDSLTLLYALAHLRKFYPKKFELFAITADIGFKNLNLSNIQKYCDDLDVPYTIIPTDIAQIVFEDRQESNPCSLCAKMRKGAINNTMKELNINKICYAHHKDDVIVTMMMSLIFEGRFHTFSPVTYLDRSEVTVLRPLIYVKEAEVKGFVNKYNVPVVKSACPVDKTTKREYVDQLIQQLNRENPGVKDRMFTAILSSDLQGWNQNGKQ